MEASKPDAYAGRSIDSELVLVDEAVAMVESGVAPRVYLAGLRFGSAVIELAREKAPDGVRVVPLWLPDGSAADLAIERDVDEPGSRAEP